MSIVIMLCIPVTQVAAAPQILVREQEEVLRAVKSFFEQEYYAPDSVSPYVTFLDDQIAVIGERALMDADAFALWLHKALQRVRRDGHLGVYGPDRTVEILGHSHFEGLDEKEPAVSQKADEPAERFVTYDRKNKLALITLRSFSSDDRVFDQLRQELSNIPPRMDVVLDLRGNRGGDSKLFRRMAGCFFEEETPIHAIRWRRGNGFDVKEHTAVPDATCSNLWHSRLVVLVDKKTASTGELAPFILQARGRATVIGEATYGASHAAEFYPLPAGFGLMMPIGKTYDRISGLDWEGVGVQPNIETTSEAALERAKANLRLTPQR